MNLIEGQVTGGSFSADNTDLSGLTAPDGAITLGFRAEDAALSDTPAQINAPVYAMELLGDATMISVRIGGALVSVKADKTYRAKIGQTVHISVPLEIAHVFDTESGARIEGESTS
jgi:multiple sugar transport system ATP-binding protein